MRDIQGSPGLPGINQHRTGSRIVGKLSSGCFGISLAIGADKHPMPVNAVNANPLDPGLIAFTLKFACHVLSPLSAVERRNLDIGFETAFILICRLGDTPGNFPAGALYQILHALIARVTTGVNRC